MATILVVDDDPDGLDYLTQLLGRQGHRLLEATDGDEALRVAHCEPPDLIISDIMMPQMDGYEFIHRLRQDQACARTPVIYYSAAYEEKEMRPLAEACGISQFLRKPAVPQAVLDIVETSLQATHPPACTLAPDSEFEREHARVLLKKLSEKVEELKAANRALVTLVELGQQLTVEHEVESISASWRANSLRCRKMRRNGLEYRSVQPSNLKAHLLRGRNVSARGVLI